MSHRPAIRALAGVCAALLIPAAPALNPHRLLKQYVQDRWADEQGYPGGVVNAFAETPDGYLWIGGENGLVRFDGLKFRVFNHANTDEFPLSAVLGLASDTEGALWVLLQNRVLLRYRRGAFERVPADMGGAVTIQGNGDIDREAGVTAIGRGIRGDVLLIRPLNSMRYRDEKFAPIAIAPRYAGRLAISVAEAPDGTLWIGTRDQGVFGVRSGETFELGGLPDRKVNCLLAGHAGGVWIGTDHGLANWKGGQTTQNALPAPLRTTQISAMVRDHDSNVWLGTPRGLMRITSEGAFEEDRRNEAPADPVRALFEDREGNLWIARRTGFERWHDSVFVTYAPSDTSNPDNSGPVYADPHGRVWFGPSSGGLYWLKGAERHEATEAGLRDVVYSIDGGPGELWIGRQRGGLTHLRYVGGSWSMQTFTAADGLANGPVYTVHRNRDGTVWAGTLNGGVSRISGGRITTYSTANGLASNTVSAIEEGAGGTMWFATANGLSAFENDRWRVYASEDGAPPARVNCLLEDSGGVLWIGTEVGLAALRNGRVRAPREAAEPLQEEIFGIAEDGLGYLWISTSKHLVRVARSHILDEAGGSAALREFGPEDGVPAPEGVRRGRSAVKDSAGRIWLSLRRGISVVEPERLGSSSAPAIVHVESVSADGNRVDAGGLLRIPATRLRIRFDYVALSLSAPERVKYRYRLDGLDHDWSEPTSEREAVYMNLPPASYRFRVIASNSVGVWNSAEAAMAMEVVPAFWQTWAFRGLIVGICALAAIAMYRMRVRRLTTALKIGFEERLDERTRIAQELHDTLLQGLLATSMHMHMILDKLPDGSTAHGEVSRVLAMMRQVVNESRDAVRGLRTPTLNADDLETALSRVREELAVPDSIGFRIIVDGPRRPLNPLIRDQVYRIAREGLSNAFRHSGAPLVEVEINYQASHLHMLVRDNGCGVREDFLRSGREGHWGLIGMRECAEKIGAVLKVRSQAGVGTELDLTIPGQIAFTGLPSGRARRWFRWRRTKARSQAGVIQL
jgi:signal transduction histidine kinase/ligand-binding sensor domain-containing protein